MKIGLMAYLICQSMFKFFSYTTLTPQKIAKDFENLSKWRNFAKSRHSAPSYTSTVNICPIYAVSYRYAKYI